MSRLVGKDVDFTKTRKTYDEAIKVISWYMYITIPVSVPSRTNPREGKSLLLYKPHKFPTTAMN